jgi:hypothetical protein
MLKVPQILHDDAIHFAEVKFYFMKTVGGERRAFALVSEYSPPNEYLLRASNNTLVVCRYNGEANLLVIDVKSILSVVAMVPFPFLLDDREDNYFMIEKVGLDVVEADIQDDDADIL